jgi:hypothetical protein
VVCREQGLTVSFFEANGVSPFLDLPVQLQPEGAYHFTPEQKKQFDLRRLECIKQWKPLVIISARWCDFQGEEKMVDLMKYIGQCGSQVLLIEQPPQVAVGNHNAAQYLSYCGYLPSQNGQKQLFPQADQGKTVQGQALIRELAQKYPFCHILKTYDYYAPNLKTAYISKGRDILYLDDDHLSNTGAFLIRPRFARAISSLVR